MPFGVQYPPEIKEESSDGQLHKGDEAAGSTEEQEQLQDEHVCMWESHCLGCGALVDSELDLHHLIQQISVVPDRLLLSDL